METYISNSVEQTKEIAFNIAKKTPVGTVIELVGEMGAGKTAFAQGFAKGLGISQQITSPTFALLNTYENELGQKLFHFDLYRLESIEELYLLGFEEIFNDKTAIVLVEWPQIALELMPKHRTKIEIIKTNETTREIRIENL